MVRQTLTRAAALALLLGAGTAAQGQEPVPAEIEAVELAEGGPLQLVYVWRYHPGDDPRWADPAFDDRSWELIEPLLPPFGRPRGGWPGTGWFRRHLRVEPAFQGKPLAIHIETPGVSTVFLDGVPLMSTAASGLRAGGRLKGGAWREVVLSPGRDHVLAVRHTLSLAERHARSRYLGFYLTIEPRDAAALRLAAKQRLNTLRSVFTAVPAYLVLLHLALFLSYPKARENLFYALAMAFWAATVFFTGSPAASDRILIASALATIFFSLLTYYAVRTRALPRTWIVFAAVAAALTGLIFLHPDPMSFVWIWYLYFGLMVAEILRVEATGGAVEREGVRVLLGGFAIVAGMILLQVLMELGLVPSPSMGIPPYMLGVLTFAVAMSIFLAQGFARTSLHLERQELSRRLLEAENARKTSEIEAARTLQLSMLPAELPAAEGLETAAAMTPASEVGGDYYDFRVAPDGSLVVAFGDATGHGVAAGIMVTAVKALFSTLGGGDSLSAVLAECSRVLREMRFKPLHMCLTLARLTPRSVTICSAAMPPVLIHRAASGEIEELGPGGPPVGSRLSGAWNERSASLSPGDTLLFASDGFAEQLDSADNPLGDERLAEVFRASAGMPASDLVERLLARVAAWRGDREQGDDVTFVVVRVTS
ncbi:MAG TPA: SpoIIE family protein phosphatase [Thermoanaerobaculia bacterium]|nr:SpoIIE family protein phosphatase [Thermoanaerobaculia bacterium]